MAVPSLQLTSRVPRAVPQPAAEPAASLRADLLESLALVLALRVAFGVFAALALLLYRSAIPPWGEWVEFAIGPGESGYLTLGPWLRFDALWYLKIARDGYVNEASVAFFPMLPILIRSVGLLIGGSLPCAGLLVSTACLAGAITVLKRLVNLDFGPVVARRTVQLLLAFPTAFFLLAPFTESLFLFLAVLTLLSARTKRFSIAAIAGGLAGLTRAQGLMLVMPLAWECLRGMGPLNRRTLPRALVPLAPAAGWAAFVIGAAVMTGGTSPIEAQQAWHYQLAAPWKVLAASWTQIVKAADVVEAFNLVTLLASSAIAIEGLRRLPLSYSLFALPQLALLATRQMGFSPLMSVSRLVLVVFPVFVIAAQQLRHPIARQATFTTCLLLQALFFFHMIQWGFVA